MRDSTGFYGRASTSVISSIESDKFIVFRILFEDVITMTILYGFLKILEALEYIADLVDCLTTPTGKTILVCLVSYQICLMTGYSELTAATIAGLMSLTLHYEMHHSEF